MPEFPISVFFFNVPEFPNKKKSPQQQAKSLGKSRLYNEIRVKFSARKSK